MATSRRMSSSSALKDFMGCWTSAVAATSLRRRGVDMKAALGTSNPATAHYGRNAGHVQTYLMP
ncbi:hypothetical protein ACU4GD_05545 [Cupriavidus basilensis]